jgi:hypothetical protein
LPTPSTAPNTVGRFAHTIARERRYVLGASVFVGLLGIWCFIAFVSTTDPFVQLLSLCMTIAYMVGTSGRNFGSSRLVIAQILCAGTAVDRSF